MSENEDASSLVEMSAEIVSAYVAHNSVPIPELPALIGSVHAALAGLTGGEAPEAAPAPLQPKIPVRRSVTADHIVCLEDGRHFKSLKRHLQAEHGLTPAAYREKWNLPRDYPMVAPAYADARAALARTIGLGRKAAAAEDALAPEDAAAGDAPAED